MRYLTYLLITLLTSIALMPCTDNSVCEITNDSATRQHQHTEDHQDACPPLCTCTCCGTLVELTKLSSPFIQAPLPDYPVVAFTYTDALAQPFSTLIWRPPTMG